MAITAGTVRAALAALQGVDLPAFEGAVSSRFRDLADDAIVAEDLLSLLAIVFPGSSGLLALAALAVGIAARSGGKVSPGFGANADALARGGRRD